MIDEKHDYSNVSMPVNLHIVYSCIFYSTRRAHEHINAVIIQTYLSDIRYIACKLAVIAIAGAYACTHVRCACMHAMCVGTRHMHVRMQCPNCARRIIIAHVAHIHNDERLHQHVVIPRIKRSIKLTHTFCFD